MSTKEGREQSAHDAMWKLWEERLEKEKEEYRKVVEENKRLVTRIILASGE